MATDINTQTYTVASGSDTYSVEEIAHILGVSKKSAYNLCEKNTLSRKG